MKTALDHWRVDELVQWRCFFRGERDTMPEGRSLRSAREKFDLPTISKLSNTQLHVMSVAAARFLPAVPYTGQRSHAKFIEDVQRCAVNPESLARKEWPAAPYLAAVRAARRALFDISQVIPQAVDNDNSTH